MKTEPSNARSHHKSEMVSGGALLSNRLERILEVSRDLVSTVELVPLLHRIVQIAVELTDTEVAGILLLDEQNHELRFKVVSQFSDRVVDIPVPIDASIAGEAFSSGEPVIVSDLQSDPRHYSLVGHTIYYEAQSLLAVPLQFRDRKVGVLEVEDKQDQGPFTAEDVAILTALAAQATIAIENARLVEALQDAHSSLEEQVAERTADLTATVNQLEGEISKRTEAEAALRRYADEQAALYSITAAISAQLDPETILYRTLDMVLPLFDSQVGWVMILAASPDSRPYLAAWRGAKPILGETGSGTCSNDCPVCETLLCGVPTTVEPILMRECVHLLAEGLESLDVGFHVASPLVVREGILGVLNIALPASHSFTDADLSFLKVIGQQTGIALYNARLYQKALQTDRLRVLNEVSAAAVFSLDLGTVLQRILESIVGAIGADEGSIFLVETETGSLTLSVTLDELVDSFIGLRLSPGQGIAGWVAQHRTAVVVNDPYNDPRFCPAVDAFTGEKTHALLCAPLQHSGMVTGVIEVVHKHTGQFTDEDLALIEAVGSIIANTIQNAQLFESLQWRVKELRILNEMGLALSSTLEPAAVSRIAVSLIQQFFKARVVMLLRLDGARENITSIYGLTDQKPLEQLTSFSLKDGLIRMVDKRREPVLIQDARSDPRWSEREDEVIGRYLDEPVRSVMLVPIADPTGTMGILLVADTTAAIYINQDIGTLLAIASTLSVALQNAYLYEAESRAREKMRGLTNRLAEVEEAERRRLAHELHDRVGQDLTALDISLEIVQQQVSAAVDDPADADALLARLEDAGELVRQTNRRIRNVMDDLHPPALEEYGLLAALRWYGTQFSRRTNIPLSITGPETVPRLAPVVETALFRVAQEALTNVARHADAAQVTVRVEVDEGTLRLVIVDDGVGLDFDALNQPGDRQRLGLQTMIERVEGIGGLFWIESEPDQGTQIVVEVSLGGSK